MSFSAFALSNCSLKKGLLSVSLLLFTSIFTTSYANEKSRSEITYDLLLAGGGLKTCSSMSVKNCTKNSFLEDAKQQILYKISPPSIERFIKTKIVQQLTTEYRLNIYSVLEDLAALTKGNPLSKNDLRKAFKRTGNLSLFQQLSDPLYYALLDSLEAPQLNNSGDRLRERVALLNTSSHASIDIYQQFVRQATLRSESDTPQIVVITASSRDPFEVADFYLDVFTQAGANTQWLPIDKTLQQARELEEQGLNGCQRLAEIRAENMSFHRESIYPERVKKQLHYCQHPQEMLAIIGNANGIFFNGGDQSLTLAALKRSDASDNDVLSLIKQKVTAGEMIVGGTSAGTAVQGGGEFNNKPVVMLTNGDSANAMQRGVFANPPPSQRCQHDIACGQGIKSGDLTYNPSGGTGLFNLGILDTHFSERDRETRLALFTAATRQKFGFGVDEASALLVKTDNENASYQLGVIGQSGVFIFDQTVGHLSQSFTANHKRIELSGISHYLTTGSKAIYNKEKGWQFDLIGKSITELNSLEPLEHGVWRDQIWQHCGSKKAFSWNQFDNLYQLKASAHTDFKLNASKTQCGYTNLPFVILHQTKID